MSDPKVIQEPRRPMEPTFTAVRGTARPVESRQKLFSNFDWKDSMLQQNEINRIESLLVEFHDIFARHRFDIGLNEGFTVKLTPKDDSPAYSQNLPTPVNLKETILVELPLLHRYGITTTLPYSKYPSSILAQKKTNGKPPLLVDLRMIINLNSDYYIKNNHPVSTLTQKWPATNFSVNSIVHKPTIVFKWQTKDLRRLHSNSRA